MSEDKEFRRDYFQDHGDLDGCDRITADVTCYRGKLQSPVLGDSEPGTSSTMVELFLQAKKTTEMFTTLCTVTADTSQMAKRLQARRNSNGAKYYHQSYSVVLLFGLTELKAQISWMEDVS